MKTGRSRFLKQTAGVTQMLFSPDGKWLATGSQAGWGPYPPCMRVWNVETGEPWGEEIKTTDAARFFFDAGSQSLLALELQDGRLRHWRVGVDPTPDEGLILYRQRKATQVVFRSDGGQVLAGFSSGAVQLFDTRTRLCRSAISCRIQRRLPLLPSVSTVPRWPWVARTVQCSSGILPPRNPSAQRSPTATRCSGWPLPWMADRSLLPRWTSAMRSWKIVDPVPDDLPLLTTWLQAAAGIQFQGDDVRHLEVPRWEECRRQLKENWPAALAALERANQPAAWYEASAREAESQRDFHGALWHLNRRLACVAPNEPLVEASLRARRAHLQALIGQREAAAREYRLLEDSIPGGAILDRYRFHADHLQATADWNLALWYLDRALALRTTEWQLYGQARRSTAGSGIPPSGGPTWSGPRNGAPPATW